MDLSLIIPCYNEQENIEKIERELLPVLRDLQCAVEMVLVDDGSVDGTWDALQRTFGAMNEERITARLERHAKNRGLGAALRTGLAASTGAVVVTTDSDGTYNFAEIPALLACLTSDIDIVTASPYHPKGGVANVPAWRLFFSRGSSILYRLLVDRRVHTYTSLFRAYRREVIEQVSFESDGFLAGTELMVKAMLAGYRVGEYPTVLHSRVFGASKAKIARTIRAHLRFQTWILSYRFGATQRAMQHKMREG